MGFGSLLLILAATGGYSIVKMKTAAVNATQLSEDYIPERDILERLMASLAIVNLNARSFGLTGEEDYLAKCRAAMPGVITALKDAGELAAQAVTRAGLTPCP